MGTLSLFRVTVFTFIISFITVALVHADFRVYDANGQFIGIRGVSPGNEVFIPSLNCNVNFSIYEDNEGGLNVDLVNWEPAIYYESPDCSGTGYLPGAGIHGGFLANSCFKSGEDTLLMIEYQNPRKSVDARSRRVSGVCSQYETFFGPGGFYPVPIVTIQGMLPFTTPIKLPLQYRYVNPMDVDGDGKTGLAEVIYGLQGVAGVR